MGSRVLYERFPSQYDNLSEEERHPTPPFPLFTPISPMPQTNGGVFVAQFIAGENADVPASPPPLPEKKSKHSKAGRDKGLSNECNHGVGLSIWELHVDFIYDEFFNLFFYFCQNKGYGSTTHSFNTTADSRQNMLPHNSYDYQS